LRVGYFWPTPGGNGEDKEIGGGMIAPQTLDVPDATKKKTRALRVDCEGESGELYNYLGRTGMVQKRP